MKRRFLYDVFLSHSSKDKAVVRPMAERLRDSGLRVWFDEWAILPGDSIPARIEEGLEYSRMLVFCMSANAFDSEWAQLESQTFRFRDPINKDRRFLPLRLDKAPIEGSLAQFRYIRWCPEDRDLEYSNLLDACRPREESDARESIAAQRAPALDEVALNAMPYKSLDDLPLEVAGVVRSGEKHESQGEVWDAANCFGEASHILKRAGLGTTQQIEALRERQRLNLALGEQLRTKYRGKPGPTLIRLFNEDNEFQRSVTKREAHSDTGLVHHTALLLVRGPCGQVVYYRRRPRQTYPGKFDFFGGHTADIDDCPRDTARREANEELQLFLNGSHLRIVDEWIHQIGDDYQLVWHAHQDYEKSTLFVVALPNHSGLMLGLADEASDGVQLLQIPNYETATFQSLARDYMYGSKEFAHGAERVMIAYRQDPDIKRQIDSWFIPSGLEPI